MDKKFDYQDWKKGKEFDLSKENPYKNEYYRGLFKEGFLTLEDYERIQNKQRWAYEKAIEINVNAHLKRVVSEVSNSKVPQRIFEKLVNEIKKELDDYESEVEEVLSGLEDYSNIRFDDYVEIRKANRNVKKRPFYRVHIFTYKGGKWVPNNNLRVACLLEVEEKLREKKADDFIKEQKKKSTTNRRGDYVQTIETETMNIDLRDYLRLNNGDPKKVYESGKPVVDQFIEYLYDLHPEVRERNSPSKRTLQRRTNKIVSEMTF